VTKYCRRNHCIQKGIVKSCAPALTHVRVWAIFVYYIFVGPSRQLISVGHRHAQTSTCGLFFQKKEVVCVWQNFTLTKNKGTFTELIRIQDKYLYTFSSFVCYMCIKDDRNILSVGRSDFMSVYKYFETKFFCCWVGKYKFILCGFFFSRNSRLRKGGIDGVHELYNNINFPFFVRNLYIYIDFFFARASLCVKAHFTLFHIFDFLKGGGTA